MTSQADAAVIFDVDGPLLNLTSREEDIFFAPLQEIYGLTDISRDWDSYAIRNDIEIYREIIFRHLGRNPTGDELADAKRRYIDILQRAIEQGDVKVEMVEGARELLHELSAVEGLVLGMATANLRQAAQARLQSVGLWDYICALPGAAEVGGPKSNILKGMIAESAMPADRIVFLGDNLNDLEAGVENGVHFIGFHPEASRRERLSKAGASYVAGNHIDSLELIRKFLRLG